MTIQAETDRHFIYLQKLASGILNAEIYPALENAYRKARATLLDAEDLASEKHFRAVQSAVAKNTEKAIANGWAAATGALESAAVYEAAFYADLVAFYADAQLRTPGPKQVKKYIDAASMTLGHGKRINAGTWAQFVNAGVSSAVEAYNGIVVTGYQRKLTVSQIAREIRSASEGILRHESDALARTGMSHYANNAREAMAVANSDIIKYRVFSATFDNRTTLGCRDLDGKHWKMDDDGYPRLPRHFNCRSSYYFVTKLSQKGEGKRAAVGGRDVDDETLDSKKELRYRGRKDSDVFKAGPISAKTTQDDWLRQQPDWFVESALGPTRAKLFLDGGMKINQFTDSLGNPINIAQLRALDEYAKHFRRAGL